MVGAVQAEEVAGRGQVLYGLGGHCKNFSFDGKPLGVLSRVVT